MGIDFHNDCNMKAIYKNGGLCFINQYPKNQILTLMQKGEIDEQSLTFLQLLGDNSLPITITYLALVYFLLSDMVLV